MVQVNDAEYCLHPCYSGNLDTPEKLDYKYIVSINDAMGYSAQ